MTAKKLEDLLSYARIKPAVNQIEIHPYWRNETTVKFCKDNVSAPRVSLIHISRAKRNCARACAIH